MNGQKGRGRTLEVGGVYFPLSSRQLFLLDSLIVMSLLLIVMGLLLVGCETAQQQAERRDWRTICQATPIREGYRYSQAEQAAMNRVGGWQLTVEEVNQRCR